MGTQQSASRTGERRKSAQPVHSENQSSASKDDIRHWKTRIRKPSSGSGGIVPDYAVQIAHTDNQVGTRRVRFPLRTPNQEKAAILAREIYRFLVANGWQTTLEKYKPEVTERTKAATIGEYLEAVRKVASAKPKTLHDYEQAFRQIVAESFGIDGGLEKYDYAGGGRDVWVAKVEAKKLAAITPARVQKWKRQFIQRAGDAPDAQARARVSVNAIIRNAKALFSPKKILPFIEGIELPDELPFDGITPEKEPQMHYRSEIDAGVLLIAAKNELGADRHTDEASVDYESRREAYKVFLLCLLAGLRRNEVDKLLWSAIRYQDAAIRIEATNWFEPKAGSAGDIEVDSELLDELKRFMFEATGPFVIESKLQPNLGSNSPSYRAQRHFKFLIGWLRSKGVSAQKPIHTLRKEFGSLICQRGGIFAASKALRHADIGITNRHYLDTKERTATGLGPLLANPAWPTAKPATDKKHGTEGQ